MIVVGMDPSLTGFGLSTPDGEHEFKTDAADGTTDERCSKITAQILGLLAPYQGPQTWVVEAPMPNSRSTSGGGHLLEAGWLLCRIEILARVISRGNAQNVRLLYVPNPTAKMIVLGKGKGGTAKSLMAKAVYKQFGLEWERDRDLNKLHAWLMRKYGEMVVSGEHEHEPPAARGKGKTAVAARKKAARA
jgi:hypothetical protein